MRGRRLVILGVSLIVVGLLGSVVTAIVLGSSANNTPISITPRNGGSSGNGGFASVGERIYKTGVGGDGRPITRSGGFGMMASGGCVNCHGWDGRGGRIGGSMMGGTTEVPDIRYTTLTSEHGEGSETDPAWTKQDITNAIRDGKEPNGETLSRVMPTWDMTDEQVDDVIAYLKELG